MSEWQHISTAPKDGSWIFLYRPQAIVGVGDRIVTGFWLDGMWAWPAIQFDIFDEDKDSLIESEELFEDNSFTLWMPIPDPHQ